MRDLSPTQISGKQLTAYRRLVRFALGLGIVGFLGGGLWLVAGAGMYGSPVAELFQLAKLTGLPNYPEFWIFWVVLAGPMGLLLYALLEKFFPHVGAVAMIIAAIAVAELGIRSGRNFWGYSSEDALIVIWCIAAPILLLGVAMLALLTPRLRWRAVIIALSVFIAGLCVQFQMEKKYWNAHYPLKEQGR